MGETTGIGVFHGTTGLGGLRIHVNVNVNICLYNVVLIVYLQEACVSPDRQVKLGCICEEQNVAVYVNRRSDWPEEQGEDVT